MQVNLTEGLRVVRFNYHLFASDGIKDIISKQETAEDGKAGLSRFKLENQQTRLRPKLP